MCAAMSVTAESLFVDYFLPLYPKEAARDLALARATDANPSKNRGIFAQLTDAARVFIEASRELFGADLGLDFTPASVHRLGAAITRARRDGWMSSGAKGSSDSQLFNVVVHGAAYVGECVVRSGGAWSARNRSIISPWIDSRATRVRTAVPIGANAGTSSSAVAALRAASWRV